MYACSVKFLPGFRSCDYIQLITKKNCQAFIVITYYSTILLTVITGKYWQKVADERKKKPARITLADKNAPNEEVWKQARVAL